MHYCNQDAKWAIHVLSLSISCIIATVLYTQNGPIILQCFEMDLDQANFSQGHNPSPIQRQNVLDGFLTNLHRLTKKKKKY